MRAVLLVLLACVLTGTVGTAQALASVDASPFAVGATRMMIGGGLLGLVALALHLRERAQSAQGRRILAPSSSQSPIDAYVAVGIGALSLLAYQPAFFAGTARSGVVLGTVVALGAAPVFAGAIDAVLHRRPPSRRWVLTTALALLGMLLTSGLLTGEGAGEGAAETASGAVDLLGILASMGAGASFAVFTAASKRLFERGWSAPSAMGAPFGLAGVLSVPVLLASGTAWLATPAGISLALWLGVVTVLIANFFYGRGLQGLSANTVVTLGLADPLTATLLGVLVLHERLSAMSALGLALIALAIVLLSLPSRAAATRIGADAESQTPTSAPR